MKRIIWGPVAAGALAAALTGCNVNISASPSSADGSSPPSSSTQNSGAPESSAPDGGNGASATGTGSGASQCTTDDLQASVIEGDPAAGNRYATLELTNMSDTSCTTGGWSGLGLANASGGVPTKVVREGDAHTITLKIGDSAYQQLRWGTVPGDGESGPHCGEPVASSLDVIPPNQRTHLRIPWTGGPVCQHGKITATPLSKNFPG